MKHSEIIEYAGFAVIWCVWMASLWAVAVLM